LETDNQNTERTDLNDLSISVREIISFNPGFLVRKGTLIISGLLIILFACLFVIKYPDALQGDCVVTTDPLPIKLKPQIGGRIFMIFVSENEIVNANAPVVELENNTRYGNITKLQSIIDTVNTAVSAGDLRSLSRVISKPLFELGDAQPIYNDLIKSIQFLKILEEDSIYSKRFINLVQQTGMYDSALNISSRQMGFTKDELLQSEDRYAANAMLFDSNVIAKQEYFEEAARLRQKKMSLEQQRLSRVQTIISIGENNKQMFELQFEKKQKESEATANVLETIRNLKYLISAPFQGQISSIRPLQTNDVVMSQEDIYTIVPNTRHFLSYADIPDVGAGKIKPGQDVHILLNDFPPNEYGFIKATVSRISSVSESVNSVNMHKVYIQVPDSIVTTFHQKIALHADMMGTAVIITRQRNLFQRLISGVLAINK
jgi:multidrug resistance efflux pump